MHPEENKNFLHKKREANQGGGRIKLYPNMKR